MDINLTGHWKGWYKYGQGYSPSIRGKSEPFEFKIKDEGGLFSGNCIDEIVKAKEGNESFIHGTYKEGNISFKKRYKYHLSINESNQLILEEGVEFSGVDYTGRLYKKIFSTKPSFIGNWKIVIEFKNENDEATTHMCEGTWKMKKFD